MTSFDPERVFAALQAAKVDYVTVGGIALIAHGVVRATLDVDLVANPAGENPGRLAVALCALDAHPWGEPETAVTQELLGRDANMRFETSAGQVDVLAATVYRRLFADLRRRAVAVRLGDVEIVVASRADLIRLKAGTGRERDLLDIGDLLALEE